MSKRSWPRRAGLRPERAHEAKRVIAFGYRVSPRRTCIPALPFCRGRLTATFKPAGYPNECKHLGHHIRRRRLELGLLQAEVARRIGVCEDSIHHWEVGDTIPAVRWLPAILAFLSHDPRPIPGSLAGHLRHWREGRRMSRVALARELCVDSTTLWTLESGRRAPASWCRLRERMGRFELG